MMIIYWAIAILVMLAYIYIPCVCLYGALRLGIDGSPLNVVCNPFFGVKKVSQKTGKIAWTIQILYLGAILSALAFCHLKGTHPFFLDFFPV